ncbi:MAG: hypothetical protein U9Q33_07885 [Campylobacterota bacterium]|nr:hypothetical protein [Campylobacterota bacterium]
MKILKYVNKDLMEDMDKEEFINTELPKYENIHLVSYGTGEKKFEVYCGKKAGAQHKFLAKVTLSNILIYVVIPSDLDLMHFLKQYHAIVK